MVIRILDFPGVLASIDVEVASRVVNPPGRCEDLSWRLEGSLPPSPSHNDRVPPCLLLLTPPSQKARRQASSDHLEAPCPA
jgi:hypothetical protein